MMHAQKIAVHAVCGFQRAEVLLIIVVQLAAPDATASCPAARAIRTLPILFLENQEKATFGLVR
jgi:hypothetical protein